MSIDWGKEKLTIKQNLGKISSLELLRKVQEVAKIGLQRLSVEPEFSEDEKVMMICGDLFVMENGCQNLSKSLTLFNCLDSKFWSLWGNDVWNEIGNIIYDLDESVMLAETEQHSFLTFAEAKLQLEDCFTKIMTYEKE